MKKERHLVDGEFVEFSLRREVLGDAWEEYDRFDLAQLEEVIRVCKMSGSLADAGRKLFDKSRLERSTRNDSDRVKKYLEKFNLKFGDL